MRSAHDIPLQPPTRRNVAVVGAGVSGLTAAYILAKNCTVTLYEAESRLGGHAHTHDVIDPAGNLLAVDTGFIVHNDRTYPQLRRLFGELGVRTRPTEMSMSIRDMSSGLEFAGGRGAKGVFAQRRRVLDPRFLSILVQVKRFHVLANAFLQQAAETDQTTYGDFLRTHRFSERFIRLYAVPVVSCVWSMGAGAALDYPARYLFRFLSHHGMLAVTHSPQWYTVVGGSRTYVDTIASRLPHIRSDQSVVQVLRDDEGVSVQDNSGTWIRYDGIVIATHADQALGLLADATVDEKEVLGAFRYSQSETVLHTDSRLLPTTRHARASWNYLTPADASADHAPVVTYWMNRLQGLETSQQYLVTLNGLDRIEPKSVLAVMDYEHPIYDLAAVEAQARLASLSTSRTAFAGAYHGWGFHEDGCRSGVEAARLLGVTW
ncbi:MAG: FAD-dependent oxidoreductase [Ilumatobacteraceae bacterium]